MHPKIQSNRKPEEVMKNPEATTQTTNQHLWQTFTMEEMKKQPRTIKSLYLAILAALVILFSACSQQPVPTETDDLEPQLIPMFWKQIGSALDVNPANNSRSPSLAVNASGNLYAAWTEDTTGSNNYKVMVKRWAAAPFNTWFSVGGALNVISTNYAITRPDGAIAMMGNTPVVAFHECNSLAFPGSCNVYVKSWNGSAWKLMGGKLNIKSGYYASVSIDGLGRPVVAWFERSFGGFSIYVKRWSGVNWVSLGGAANVDAAKLASMPSLAIKNDKVAVAWQECITTVTVSGNISPFTCQHRIFARFYDAATNTWKAWLGASGAINVNSNRDAKLPSLELTSTGTPVVAFVECVQVGVACHENSDHNVYVKRYGPKRVGGFIVFGFQQLGSALDVNIAQATKWPSLAIGLNDTPVVAWSEGGSTGSGFAGIRVRAWNAASASWKPYSGVSDSPLNISQTQHADEPSLVISSTGKPSVAFQEGQEGGNGVLMNIYVRQLQPLIF
jgi:hypothetical protein